MKNIIDFALKKTKTTLLFAVLIIIVGSYSRVNIPIAASPNVTLPFVTVAVFLEGASPDDTSRLIARPLENRLNSVPGLKSIRSDSTLSFSRVFLEFEVGYDIDKALVDIKQGVEEIKNELPPSAEDPIIEEYNESNFPVMNLSIVGNGSLRQKVFHARELKEHIESLEEILAANLSGAPDEVLEGVIDKSKMESLGVTLSDIYYSVSNNNLIIPGGKQDAEKGSFNIEVPSVIETAQDVYSIPIKVTPNAVVTLQDIAEIRRTFKDYDSYVRVNGQDAVSLEITLRTSANAIDASRGIRDIVNEYKNKLPPNLELVITDDDSIYAVQMVKELNGNIIAAVILIMILVIATMGIRVSMLVGLSIPFCFLMTYLVLHAFGMEANFLVMMGLLLGMGMLIDGSIVVTEYADKKISEGLTRKEAYRGASKRMFYPILSSTATTIAAFTPLLVWPGFTGQFMKYLPITVIIVLCSSLFYSLILTPVMGANFGQRKGGLGKDNKTFTKIIDWYGNKIEKFVKNPIETIICIGAILSFILVSYSYYSKGTVYFAIVDPVKAEISIRGRGNLSSTEKKEIIQDVEAELIKIEELQSVYLRAGTEWWRSGSDKVGSGFVEIVPAAQRDISGLEVMQMVTEKTGDIPGIIVEAQPDLGGPSFSSPIQISIYGLTEESAKNAAIEIENKIRSKVSGLTNIFSSNAYSAVEWSVEVDKQKAAQLGVSIGDVGALVQMLTSGFKAGEFRPDDAKEEVEIRVRFPKSDRTLTGISDLNVTTRNGSVPVSSFINVIPKENREKVSRQNGKYYFRINAATVDESAVDSKVAEIKELLKEVDLENGVSYAFEGMQEETDEVNAFLQNAGIAAVFIMLILLVTQFNSFYQAIIILLSVVISFIGVLLGLLITGKAFSSTMTGISIVTLAGIVVNNNIVLIDTFNALKNESPHIEKSIHIINACKQRLRPIVLTSSTTIYGLLPLALGMSIDILNRDIFFGSPIVDWWSNLAVSIVFGLGFSTFITLILTPAVLALPYALRNDFKKLIKSYN